MLDILMFLVDLSWHILQYVWQGLVWFFHLEERLLIWFDVWGWSNAWQIPIISLVNAVVIALEIFGYINLAKIFRIFRIVKSFFGRLLGSRLRRFFKRVILFIREKFFRKKPKDQPSKVARLLTIISHDKPIGCFGLATLTLIPECQKVASFIFTTQRKRLGLGGYLSLCAGGTTRLTLVVYLPMVVVWSVIVLAVSCRLLKWLVEIRYGFFSWQHLFGQGVLLINRLKTIFLFSMLAIFLPTSFLYPVAGLLVFCQITKLFIGRHFRQRPPTVTSSEEQV
ncbi:MAG: hypothetical protein A2543_02720 [Candidatus Komeilibacteria bacterium RIFOXYD2_FULL_37_8]|nr:MAG: hypothetical protein A2611_00145 [Candidatus Komeilibacteria bacterium RIFOXYD1_FULL_37_29]OGY96110.1 MAG: hypothetical protein A2543_02720 [Candidatus Komeilibacteria bacterium RIFOXYD2_FULL_37_8]